MLHPVYPPVPPEKLGWPKGWTASDTTCSQVRPHIKPHPIFQGGVHERIYELVNLLVEELERRGYRFREGWSWGFACRGTKTSSGSKTGTPSFHSYGLALDFNAPLNPFGASQHSMPDWVVDLMREYGFFWLGPPIKDWMHFHFCGTPADADRMLTKARKNFGPVWVIGGKKYRKLPRALRRVKRLLKQGKAKVVVKRRR